jgi:hypothetical protein
MYPTNSPVTEYWPVFMGVAYVDIPAVEGLNGEFAKQHHSEQYSIQMEVPMPEAPKPQLPPTAEFKIGGVTTNDFAKVQAYISELESKSSGYQSQIASLTTERDGLAEFKRESIKASREDFVTSLGKPGAKGEAPKLTAPMLESEKAFAATLNDDQFAAYKKRWELAPSQTILENHGHQSGDEGHRPAEQDGDKPSARDTLVAIVKGLRDHSSMKPEAIMQTGSWRQLVALDSSVVLSDLK